MSTVTGKGQGMWAIPVLFNPEWAGLPFGLVTLPGPSRAASAVIGTAGLPDPTGPGLCQKGGLPSPTRVCSGPQPGEEGAEDRRAGASLKGCSVLFRSFFSEARSDLCPG